MKKYSRIENYLIKISELDSLPDLFEYYDSDDNNHQLHHNLFDILEFEYLKDIEETHLRGKFTRRTLETYSRYRIIDMTAVYSLDLLRDIKIRSLFDEYNTTTTLKDFYNECRRNK